LSHITVLGRENNIRQQNLGMNVVLELSRPYFGTNRGVTADNFFSGIALATELLRNGLTFVGTMRKTRREIPTELAIPRGRDLYSSIFVFRDDASLVSYKTHSSRIVLLLSTQHHERAIAPNRADEKPEIILHYNSTKGGVDSMDQMVGEFTCVRPTKRWPLKVL